MDFIFDGCSLKAHAIWRESKSIFHEYQSILKAQLKRLGIDNFLQWNMLFFHLVFMAKTMLKQKSSNLSNRLDMFLIYMLNMKVTVFK